MDAPGSCFVPKAVLALVTLLFLAGGAMAYVGPGAGPEFFGYFLSLLAWVGVALSALLLWPVYALIRRFRGGPKSPPVPTLPPAPPGGQPEGEAAPR
jgi:hypothetical protein